MNIYPRPALRTLVAMAVLASLPAAAAPARPPGDGPSIPPPIDTHGVSRIFRNLPYATLSDKEKLDIYLPDHGSGPYKVILAVHGGGFAGGDKDTGEVNPEMAGLDRGYAVVAVNYRLARESPEQHRDNGGPNAPPLSASAEAGSPFPAAEMDLKAAVRFLRASAATYHLDTNHIVAWGDSAGANLASLLGTSAGVAALEDRSMGNPDQPSTVQLVVDLFGPTNFLTMDTLYAGTGITPMMRHSGPHSSESDYMGAPLTSIPDKVKRADPTTYVSAKSPPFLIENGSLDAIVPPQQDTDLAAALTNAIGAENVEHIVVEGAHHGGVEYVRKSLLDQDYAFIAAHLK